MEYKKITVVDRNDQVIGFSSWEDAIRHKSIKRGSRVFVFNDKGEFLLQKRSQHISKPGLFDQSAAGHVDEGEDYYTAAVRELHEELGLDIQVLTEVALSYRTDDFFNAIYKVTIPSHTIIDYNRHEVESVLWLAPQKVDQLVRLQPELCTQGFVEIWTKLRDTLVTA